LELAEFSVGSSAISMKRLLPLIFSLLATLSAATTTASAQTATVTTTDDIVDFGGAQQISDLPGPDGLTSFREATTAANNTPGPQTIAFAIPNTAANEWNTGVAILFMDFTSFSLIDDGTTVDFTTQTAFTGDTNPFGNEVGIRTTPPAAGSSAIFILANDCTIKGLDRVIMHGYAVRIMGNNNRVIGCTIWGAIHASVYINGLFNGPPATGNIIGGLQPGEGNLLTSDSVGVRIDGPALDNVVIGNIITGGFMGVEVRTPTCCPGNDAINNRIGGPTVAERNVIHSTGIYGEEGFPEGGMVLVEYSTNTTVEGNYMGVNADGISTPNQLAPIGLQVRESPGTVVRDNLIGGLGVDGINHALGLRFGTAMHIQGDCSGSIIQGNSLGIDASGAIALTNYQGMHIDRWPGSTFGPLTIGGTLPGEGNTIANSELTGLRIDSQIKKARISGNSLHDNGALGIDLLVGTGQTGNTPNDSGDLDDGANALQNYPVLTQARAGAGTTTIVGTLDTRASRNYDLEFFGSATCDASGFGEGELFLGTTSVTTDAAGMATFNVTLPTALPSGWLVTATATGQISGNTSEYSACVPAQTGLALTADPLIRGQAADLTATGAQPNETVYYLYSLTGLGVGPCPGALGGLCLDVLAPVFNSGNAPANAGGSAIFTVQIPAQAPLIDVYLQAVIRRGPGGAQSIKSNTVTTMIQ
jgi:hypothetical protein